MLLEELAKDLVRITSSLVGGRTINIMNTDGIIIASTESERIGTYHEGAGEAVRTGKLVNIRKDQLDRYPGAKEGCNMPIHLDGSIIGVVGIYGEPEEIRDVAHLLEVYAEKYYQMEALLRPRLSESALRSQLLENLLSPSEEGVSTAKGLLDRLKINLSVPIETVVISAPQGLGLLSQAEKLCRLLEKQGFLEKRSDVWGVVEERMVLLCGHRESRKVSALKTVTEAGYRVSRGDPSHDLKGIRDAYAQACLLDRMGTGMWNDVCQLSTRCGYLLERTALADGDFLDALAERLRSTYPAEELGVMLESVKCYYNCGRSVTTAAEKQFIHKNTLQYRVKRVLEALELDPLPAFWQEYLVRLIISRLQRDSGVL